MSARRARLFPATVVLASALGAAGAQAQQAARLPAPPDMPSIPAGGMAIPGAPTGLPSVPGVPAIPSDPFALPDGIRVTLGAQALMMPKFEGSKSYTVSALPVFKFAPLGSSPLLAAAGQSFNASSLDDLSFAVAKLGGVEVGPLVGSAGRPARRSAVR